MIVHKPKRLFEFGPFRVDTRERLLLRDGIAVPLTPKAFDILLALVENHGRTLGTDELIERVWTDAFVEVGNLNRNISTLRSVLGEPGFIKTFPKRGYRFEADVREILQEEEPLVIERRTNYRLSIREVTARIESSSSIFSRGKFAAVSAFAGILVTLSLAWVYNSGSENIQGRVSAEGRLAAGTENAEAFELYRKGRALWQNRSGESLHEATLLLEQAVTVDPNFALGQAALADAYAFDWQNHKNAEATANQALELAPNLGEPHATIGFVKMFWDWELVESQVHFKQAVTLSPDYATGHQWYAINLIATGQGNEALAEIKRALELEPDSLAVNSDMCQILYFSRRYDQAEAQCKRALALDEKFLNANLYLYDIYMAKEMYSEAIAQFLRNEELAPNYSTFPGQVAELQDAFQTGGVRAFWQKRIELLRKRPISDYAIARYHARLGEKDEALNRLKRAYERHDLNFLFFHAEPLFTSCCYPDPRYAELMMLLTGEEDHRQ